MSTRRNRLSTHYFHFKAKAAQGDYEAWQDEAKGAGPSAEYARVILAKLGIGLTDAIEVKRASHEAGRWVVIAS